MRATVQNTFYRSGQLRERVPLRNGRRHGVVRTWHRNGRLASEEPFRGGLLHGVCRQWSEGGRLLGEYRMVHGTGIQRAWHDNGQLQLEVSTVGGEFSGRNRIWLRDGTLLSERFHVRGRVVTAAAYHAAAAQDKTLPRFRGKPARPRVPLMRVHRVFAASLLEKPNNREARQWLTRRGNQKTARSLGRFRCEQDAAQFVEELYRAGAVAVIVPDIYRNKQRDQFADCLLVQLPKGGAGGKAIHKVCEQLRTRGLGAVQPDKELGERHLYLSLA